MRGQLSHKPFADVRITGPAPGDLKTMVCAHLCAARSCTLLYVFPYRILPFSTPNCQPSERFYLSIHQGVFIKAFGQTLLVQAVTTAA